MVGVASFIDIFQFLSRFAKDSRRYFFQKRRQLVFYPCALSTGKNKRGIAIHSPAVA